MDYMNLPLDLFSRNNYQETHLHLNDVSNMNNTLRSCKEFLLLEYTCFILS